MKHDPESGTLTPFNFGQIQEEVPELKKFGFQLDTISFAPLVDSSDIQPDFWVTLATIIKDSYEQYDGFVVLHGTDTMSYTASALSFMLQNLSKPVILTGSQLPIGMLRTDGKENLISAIEIAAEDRNGIPLIQEVCIFFQDRLFRGNRTTKHNAEDFNAFRSENYPPLAEAGINLKYYVEQKEVSKHKELTVFLNLDTNIAILKLFPGIQPQVVDAILSITGIRAVIIETFGSGNAPTASWFIRKIENAVNRGIIILNITQCHAGRVEMELYETGITLKKAGVVSGYDSTIEAATTKLMHLLGTSNDASYIKKMLEKSISGEISN